ncbi:Rare lipoprotein A precursor [hydrothermal vent metagenome]|uniref:Rare lipoprotein A n=1 Tax=hydrothermal vent metagenome TaxID=652676 RepID=A0A1W1E7M2_9ZZZZ
MRKSLFLFFPILSFMLLFIGGCSEKKVGYKATRFTSAARHKSTMRCYTVLGRTYQPTYVKVGQTMEGISSWYGPNFHGKLTSNGERYNMYKKTAAHKTWPMDTMVRVTNLQNGKSTVVRINDRGPFVKGRIIDCSYAAGKDLGLDKTGIAKVRLEVVGFAGKVESKAKIAHQKATKTQKRMKLNDFGIQLGAFTHYAGAKATQKEYRTLFKGMKRLRVVIKHTESGGRKLYRVWLMGFGSEAAARDFRACQGLSGSIVRN